MSTTLIIILIIAALLVLWGISVQNKLVQADELCNNALKQINVRDPGKGHRPAQDLRFRQSYRGRD